MKWISLLFSEGDQGAKYNIEKTCFLQNSILHMIKNILWKFNLYIFNIDWVRSCQIFKL